MLPANNNNSGQANQKQKQKKHQQQPNVMHSVEYKSLSMLKTINCALDTIEASTFAFEYQSTVKPMCR